MMVCPRGSALRGANIGALLRTVLPEPLRPTMSVRGLGNVMTPPCSGLKLRMPLMSRLWITHKRSASTSRCSLRVTRERDSCRARDDAADRQAKKGSEPVRTNFTRQAQRLALHGDNAPVDRGHRGGSSRFAA